MPSKGIEEVKRAARLQADTLQNLLVKGKAAHPVGEREQRRLTSSPT